MGLAAGIYPNKGGLLSSSAARGGTCSPHTRSARTFLPASGTYNKRNE